MKNIINDFRLFVLRGNVVDFVVGVIMATSFRAIVDSWVDDIIMPPLGYLFGDIDLTEWEIILRAATPDKEAIAIRVGQFLNVTLELFIILIACFVFIRFVNGLLSQIKEKKQPTKSDHEEMMEMMERVALALEKQNRANGIQ